MGWFGRIPRAKAEADKWAAGIEATANWAAAVAVVEELAQRWSPMVRYKSAPTAEERRLRESRGGEEKYDAAIAVLRKAGPAAIEPLALSFINSTSRQRTVHNVVIS